MARRLEVISGASGRRWSADVKAKIIEETLVPDASVAEVAPRHGLAVQQLYVWRREARTAASDLTFVPAMLDDAELASLGREITVQLDGVALWGPKEVSAAHLAMVIRAIRSARGAAPVCLWRSGEPQASAGGATCRNRRYWFGLVPCAPSP